jgi:hypothetical protein
MLKPLILPQLVEERKRRESLKDAVSLNNLEVASANFVSQNSSSSDLSWPASPVSSSSTWRYSSSPSSVDIASSASSAVCLSPILASVKPTKTALPDVEEEHERDADYVMCDNDDDLYDCFCE